MDCQYPLEKMSKLLVIPINKDNFINLNKRNIDGFIIGLKGYSVFTSYDINIDEIKEIIKLTDKEIYISINKPLFVEDIDKLKPIIENLSKLNIKGIIYDDIGLLNIVKEYNINLIWNQLHLGTNYETCNYWYKKGVKGSILSTELMLDDYINIKRNTSLPIFVYIYGYLPMFESSRELLTNYFKYMNSNKKDDVYYLYEKERDKYYTIYENNDNTYILEDLIDGIEEVKVLKENNIDYLILNGLNHEEEIFNSIVDSYIETLNGNIIRKSNNKGFLYKETIYKVKNE